MSEITQSTRHIMMMEPAAFYSNPQTMETNQYQAPNPYNVEDIQVKAVQEFHRLRDMLVENGVIITSVIGQEGCPDDVYCNNWVSTHIAENGVRQMVLYPMLAENRRTERRVGLLGFLDRQYDTLLDISAEELKGRYLESTGSLAMDRINGVIYSTLSRRTDIDLARKVADKLGYEIEFFETCNHAGKPVYHTDVVMFLGTGYIGICAEAIVEQDRERVLNRMRQTHEVIELSMEQLRAFCGNALEVRGREDERMLAMSGSAYRALRDDQKSIILKYVSRILHSDIPTIEKYGGGSVRCMLLELY